MKYILVFLIFFTSTFLSQEVDNSILTALMKDYNHSGEIDYKNLKSDKWLNDYLSLLSNTIPENLKGNNEKLAFWINVYNAFTLKIIVDNYPLESINDLHTGGRILGHIFSTTVWDEDFIEIDGEKYSLNYVEHNILRKEFDEPRIHFAIVCASISCPKLREEAYSADKIEQQLEDQAVIFFNDKTKNIFDVINKIAYLSKIMDWFDDDFGENDEEILLFAARFLDEELKKDISTNLNQWSIEYLDYDWNLNEYKNE